MKFFRKKLECDIFYEESCTFDLILVGNKSQTEYRISLSFKNIPKLTEDGHICHTEKYDPNNILSSYTCDIYPSAVTCEKSNITYSLKNNEPLRIENFKRTRGEPKTFIIKSKHKHYTLYSKLEERNQETEGD